MARKRKTYQEQKKQPEQQVAVPVLEWPTAIYARLSIVNSGKDDDGDSIENQVEICRDYLEEHPYLHLHDIYMDNGWTGTNTNRPEFQRMLDDIHAGKVKAIIIKDFSRFSRDYIEAGNMLENVFPFLGVRFISVTDHYDSFETDGSAESLLIPLKNLINSYYSKDISRKVTTSIHSRQLAGQHLPSKIPYGYLKSETEEYRLTPDPETRDVVTRIFREFNDGVSISTIVHELNDEGIPSPGRLRYIRGVTKKECCKDSRWNVEGIKQFLRNPTYTGDLAFGRYPKALYLGITKEYGRERDESKWRVLPNMHEPLIDRETFRAVNERLAENRKKKEEIVEASQKLREEYPAILLGYVFCGDCGSRMAFSRHRSKNKGGNGAYCNYLCLRHEYKRCEYANTIQQGRLVSIVWNAIHDQLTYFCDFDKMIQSLKSSGRETAQQISYKDEIQSVLLKINGCMKKRERLYEDFSDGLLSAEDYMSFKKRYDEENQELNKRLNHLQTMQNQLKLSLSEKNQWMVHMRMMQNETELRRELVEALIERINIYHGDTGRRVEIIFKYRQDFEALQNAFEEWKEGADA
ncbi:MAG: recombinase family protein [Lachnospiraceae bacterium]|nr:recombinase family protein [Lachnospiraceae bacterium]